MMVFWLDQIITWIVVALGWWIIHQTGDFKRCLSSLLIRLGVGGFAFSLAVIAVTQEKYVSVPIAGVVIKLFIAILFVGIIRFHRIRFKNSIIK